MTQTHRGEVWWAIFPYEEDPTQYKHRPVVVIDQDIVGILSVKVTSQSVRDKYDVEIVNWQYAKLNKSSVVRVSKLITILESDFDRKIGKLHPDDLLNVETTLMEWIKDNQ